MTILDANTRFSDSQALTVTADSTNAIDLTSDRDVGPGEPMAAIVYVETALGGTSSPTLQVSIETDDNDSFSSGSVLTASKAYSVAEVGSSGFEIVVPLPMNNERYLQLIYTLTGTSPTATVSAYFLPQSSAENQRYLPKNFTVTSVA